MGVTELTAHRSKPSLYHHDPAVNSAAMRTTAPGRTCCHQQDNPDHLHGGGGEPQRLPPVGPPAQRAAPAAAATAGPVGLMKMRTYSSRA